MFLAPMINKLTAALILQIIEGGNQVFKHKRLIGTALHILEIAVQELLQKSDFLLPIMLIKGIGVRVFLAVHTGTKILQNSRA